MVKNPPANTGDTELIPGFGRALGIPWTKEPGGLQFMDGRGVEYDSVTKQ